MIFQAEKLTARLSRRNRPRHRSVRWFKNSYKVRASVDHDDNNENNFRFGADNNTQLKFIPNVVVLCCAQFQSRQSKNAIVTGSILTQLYVFHRIYNFFVSFFHILHFFPFFLFSDFACWLFIVIRWNQVDSNGSQMNDGMKMIEIISEMTQSWPKLTINSGTVCPSVPTPLSTNSAVASAGRRSHSIPFNKMRRPNSVGCLYFRSFSSN